jgi:S1-C subfamily serine protease
MNTLSRKTGSAAFSQPIARESRIRTGEPVFAIGHPQRLFYTLSSGLVSRAGNPTLVQFSAPVSPGNSGGPLYDSFGNLLGIVAAMVDRAQSPNAENLNFAVRAEAFLNQTGWRLSDPAYAELRRLKASQPDKQIH